MGLIGERGHRGGPPGIQEGAWRDQEGGRARHPSGCLVGPLTSIFGEPQSIPKIMTPVNFIAFGVDLIQQLGVHFSQLNSGSAASAPESCKLCKTSQNYIRTIL